MKKYRLYKWPAVISLTVMALLLINIFFLHQGERYTNMPGHKEPPKLPNDWFFIQRSYPGKTINYKAWRQAQQQAETLHRRASGNALSWQEAGPTNVGGRITALAVHPSFPDRIYLGAADGGVWFSQDAGNTWTPIFDFNPTLSIGALAIDPADPNILYVGTGEANTSADSYPGNGIFKSTDGGSTWDFSGLEESYHIGRIAVNPQNTQQIFVAAAGLLFGKNEERGIYRSEDGGTNWERVLFISDSTAGIDVAIDPLNPANVYAAMWERIRYPGLRIAGGVTSGIYKSTDGGDNWMLLSNGLPAPAPTVGRIGLAIAATNPSVVYAIYADHPGYFAGVYKTTDGGSNWFRVNDGVLSNLYSSFGWYFGNIYVDPADESTVYTLGVPLYKSVNGGNSWFEIGFSIHVDQHAIWANPANPQHILIGNDGGFYVSQNGGSSFTKKSGLPITQYYAATVDYNFPERLYGGTQDNGTNRTLTGALDDWERILGGDGFYVIVDPTNSNIIYAEYQFGGLNKSTNGGSIFFSATSGISGSDRTNWMTPVVMDPNNANILYYGSQRIYKTVNGASFWTPLSSDLSNGPYPNQPGFGTITTMDVASTNPDIIYAGTDDGNIWVTPDGGGNWTKISDPLPVRWVTRVRVHPNEENIALVTFSGFRYDQYIGHIYRTTNAGQSWEDLSGNLPEAPLQVVVIDPDQPEIYYVGSDLGVYYSTNAGVSWEILGVNLPGSGVMDLVLHQPTRTLVAATHGRSMFKIDISNPTGVWSDDPSFEKDFILKGIYPNPFNIETAIEFRTGRSSPVSVAIYDINGRKVKQLLNETMPAGNHRLQWRGTNGRGNTVASGVYLVRITAGTEEISRRITLVK
jgi:photosystem II stability/assembly factor-like uncharacterized protein